MRRTLLAASLGWSFLGGLGSSLVAAEDRIPGLVIPLHEVQVGTPVSGIVKEVLVKEGDTVAKNDTLAFLENDLETLDVQRAEKILEKAKFDDEAAQKLLAESIGTREAALTRSIEHDLARIQLETAKAKLQQKQIVAPLQGIVVKKAKEAGEALLLNETIVQIVHIQQVYAQFYLEPAQAESIQLAQQLSVLVPSMQEPNKFKGEVVFIDPRMDAESGLYRIKLKVDNVGLRLKAGMRAELSLGELRPLQKITGK